MTYIHPHGGFCLAVFLSYTPVVSHNFNLLEAASRKQVAFLNSAEVNCLLPTATNTTPVNYILSCLYHIVAGKCPLKSLMKALHLQFFSPKIHKTTGRNLEIEMLDLHFFSTIYYMIHALSLQARQHTAICYSQDYLNIRWLSTRY